MNDDLYQKALQRRKTLLEVLDAIEAELRSLENSILVWEKRSAHNCSDLGSIPIVGGETLSEKEEPLLSS